MDVLLHRRVNLGELVRNLGSGIRSREHGRNVSIETYSKLPMLFQEIDLSYLNQ